jgi:FtsH-binding integral membrane protein
MTGSRPAGWRKRAPQLLAGIGSILVLAVTFLPWYRVGTSHLLRTAWQEDQIVLALLLAVVVAGAALALAGARGRPVPQRAVWPVFGLTLITTLVVVFTLFIDRPGGNAATAVAFGGYPALLGVNLVKASVVVTHALARRGRRHFVLGGR